MSDIEKTAIVIRDAIRDLPKRYTENCERIKQLDDETNDLMHYLELTRFHVVDGYKIAKRIQEIRQERRILKDENEQLKHLQPYLADQRNKLGQLDRIIGDIRQSIRVMPERRYRCRVRKDLEVRINSYQNG